MHDYLTDLNLSLGKLKGRGWMVFKNTSKTISIVSGNLSELENKLRETTEIEKKWI
jgi:hypothetical protein